MLGAWNDTTISPPLQSKLSVLVDSLRTQIDQAYADVKEKTGQLVGVKEQIAVSEASRRMLERELAKLQEVRGQSSTTQLFHLLSAHRNAPACSRDWVMLTQN